MNSAEMVKTLSDLTLEDADVLVYVDLIAFFTKFPVDKSLLVIIDYLENDIALPSRTKLSQINI